MKKVVNLVFLAAALGYSVWCWVFQSGPYAYLVRWQAATFETYFPSLTFAAILMGILSIWYLVELVVTRGKAGAHRPKSNMEVSLDELKLRLKKRTRWNSMAVVVLVGGALLAYYFGQSAPGDSQSVQNIDLRSYQGGNHWFEKLELDQGVLLGEHAYSIVSQGNRGYSSETRYTPIISTQDAQAKIHFVHLQTSNHNLRQNSKLAMTGFVSPTVLPVLVRDDFKRSGLNLSDRVHVIGDSVVSLQMALFIAAGILGLIAFFLLFTVLFAPLGRRRIIADWHKVNGAG